MIITLMCSIDEQLRSQDRIPSFYKRYVDDTFSIMPDVPAASVFLSITIFRSEYDYDHGYTFFVLSTRNRS